EDVAVRVAHDLVQLELLLLVQALNPVHSRETIGKESPGVVEVPALQNLAFIPGDLERVLQDVGVGVVVRKHGTLPALPTMPVAMTSNNGNSVPNRPDWV